MLMYTSQSDGMLDCCTWHEEVSVASVHRPKRANWFSARDRLHGNALYDGNGVKPMVRLQCKDRPHVTIGEPAWLPLFDPSTDAIL